MDRLAMELEERAWGISKMHAQAFIMPPDFDINDKECNDIYYTLGPFMVYEDLIISTPLIELC